MISPRDTPPAARAAVVLVAALFEGGLAVLAWLLGWLTNTPPAEQIRARPVDFLWGALATAPMLLAMVWIARSRWRPFRRLTVLMRRVVAPWFAGCTVLDLALISLLAGLGEEALFRGFLQTWLSDPLGLAPAVALSALLFGLAHWITPTYGVFAILVGLYFSALTIYFDNLVPAIVAHALYDFLALLYLTRTTPRRPAGRLS